MWRCNKSGVRLSVDDESHGAILHSIDKINCPVVSCRMCDTACTVQRALKIQKAVIDTACFRALKTLKLFPALYEMSDIFVCYPTCSKSKLATNILKILALTSLLMAMAQRLGLVGTSSSRQNTGTLQRWKRVCFLLPSLPSVFRCNAP